MSIPFTQYLRPDGRKISVKTDRPENIETLAQKIISRGYRFECEELTTGEVSFTIVGPLLPPDDPTEEGDAEIEVVPNGPEVPEAVDRMIKRFSEKLDVQTTD